MKPGFGIGVACLCLATVASAGTKGEAARIVADMDKAMTSTQDQYFVYQIVTQEPGKKKTTLEFQVHIKGDSWRRLEFTAPGDVKGMRFLVRSLTQMYVYLPAYQRVRRVASHVRDQGFMGTAYAYDEMAIVTYGPVFDAELISQADDRWILKMKRKPGQDYRYAGLELEVDKKMHQPLVIRYYNDKWDLLKTETRTDWECQGSACRPREMKIIDHTRGDMWSKMVCQDWKINTGVKDSFFTVRSLQRGR